MESAKRALGLRSSSGLGCDHDNFLYLLSSDVSFVDVDKIW